MCRLMPDHTPLPTVSVSPSVDHTPPLALRRPMAITPSLVLCPVSSYADLILHGSVSPYADHNKPYDFVSPSADPTPCSRTSPTANPTPCSSASHCADPSLHACTSPAPDSVPHSSAPPFAHQMTLALCRPFWTPHTPAQRLRLPTLCYTALRCLLLTPYHTTP